MRAGQILTAFCLLASCFFFQTSAGAACYGGGPMSGLIHWWKLDEAPGATTAVDSAGSANMTLGGTAAFTTSGKIAKCPEFA
jgi:hypothetical protein